MRLAIINKKGGQAKSTIAYTLAKGFPARKVITNDSNAKMREFLEEDVYEEFESDEYLPIYPNNVITIYDLGGFWTDPNVRVLESVDMIVLALQWGNENDWKSTMDIFGPVTELNKPVAFVLTWDHRDDSTDNQEVPAMVAEALEPYPNITLYILKWSKTTKKALGTGISDFDYMETWKGKGQATIARKWGNISTFEAIIEQANSIEVQE